jgi:ATP-binding cassette subfamily C (CFTR/MRP) protein 1
LFYAQVEFRDVVLAYPRQPEPALRGLTLTIEAGSSVGVVGRTGAGKSTLVQTILRLYPNQSGSVLVDGVDVASVGLKTLRGRVAIVPQAPTLFAGTIRFNLDMFGERTDEELEAALELARGSGLAASGSLGSLTSLASLSSANGATEEATDMPANRVASLALDFELSEFGANLSVGERQLLCLARAIARKSRLVLMDEATANVDQKTDRLVQRVLNGGALGGATRITIAHRLGTIAACDAVAVLDDGKLLEYAAPSSLLADADSGFSKLCDAAGSRASLIDAARRADERRANGGAH